MDRGILAMISHLATMPALAAGCALAQKIKKSKNVSIAFIGEGGTSLGDFHETLNLAAVLSLPFVLIIENNQWAYSTPTSKQYLCKELSSRAAGYNIPGITIDGTDVELVYSTVKNAVELARKGKGPSLIETVTMRLRGHSAADMAEYVPEATIKKWQKKHPVKLYQQKLKKKKWLSDSAATKLEQKLTAEVEAAIAYALSQPYPEPHTTTEGVYAE
jgi:TPP-dependent pyruvate/acetoin dehydrogenase alpha subunit